MVNVSEFFYGKLTGIEADELSDSNIESQNLGSIAKLTESE